jgi:hypothetical protein
MKNGGRSFRGRACSRFTVDLAPYIDKRRNFCNDPLEVSSLSCDNLSDRS